MDTKLLFQTISRKMRADFDLSAQIQHAGSKGTVRENVLRNFLAEGRMPSKYGLGSGEIVGRIKDTSRQCDLIVYDKLNGVTLLFDEHTQVYPIDCIYGIVEVKSALSKEELLDSLSKIASFKSMSPTGIIESALGGGMRMLHGRPKPFGIVFAYGLKGNSLDSLRQNLVAWEKEHDFSLWPNYICVLEEGVIYHQGEKAFDKNLNSEAFTADSWPISLYHREDSLFQFYCALHDLCAHMRLGPVELLRYYTPFERVGKYVLDGPVEFQRLQDGKKVRFAEAALDRVVSWCGTNGSMTYGAALEKQFGNVPIGLDARTLEQQVFLYKPDNLPGLHELGEKPFEVDENGAHFTQACLASAFSIRIDGNAYIISLDGFTADDYVEVAG